MEYDQENVMITTKIPMDFRGGFSLKTNLIDCQYWLVINRIDYYLFANCH